MKKKAAEAAKKRRAEARGRRTSPPPLPPTPPCFSEACPFWRGKKRRKRPSSYLYLLFPFFMVRISPEKEEPGGWRERKKSVVASVVASAALGPGEGVHGSLGLLPSPSRVRTQNPKTKSPRFDKNWANFFEETCTLESIFCSSRDKKGMCLS